MRVLGKYGSHFTGCFRGQTKCIADGVAAVTVESRGARSVECLGLNILVKTLSYGLFQEMAVD